jgi:hypothetical protein
VCNNIFQLYLLVSDFVKTLKGCSIVLAHVLADVAIFIENFEGEIGFTRFH